MTVDVRYYAVLREQAGKTEEQLAIDSSETTGSLYEKLRSTYDFTLSQNDLRVAVNDAFSNFTTPLSAGDKVVFIPPVAGG